MRARRRAETRTVVTGVIGADCHIVGNRILQMALEEAGFKVVPLGIMVSQEEFVKAAVETDAAAILVSSLYGQGELDCQGLRDKFEEAGLGRIHLVVGGNLVVGKQEWDEVERRFLAMGFNRAYPPGVDLRRVIDELRRDLGGPARDG
ncbi:MAG: methylaspartate mutase subunit S [Candidatus Rokubacteria bacterium]|nr:methylaspartate mutase subunit S [Candidatus Rokubacteria bacterium]